MWISLFCYSLLLNNKLDRYPNLYEVRLIPTKKDIAFVEYLDEASATVAKDALHNYKLDGENKIKVMLRASYASSITDHEFPADYIRKEVKDFVFAPCLLLFLYDPLGVSIYYSLVLIHAALAGGVPPLLATLASDGDT